VSPGGEVGFHHRAVVVAVAAGALLALAATSSGTEARGVDVHVFRFVDHSRTVLLPDGRRVARPVTTVVRYPASGGPYPLVVFGHGFTLTPGTYSALLRAWTRAGYVVAAPVFPLGNANAPGGPTEADLPNQPADMSLVITRLLALARQRGGLLHDRIDPRRIAVAGQSDGGVTALGAAYDSRYRDRRIRAAVILSGAEPTGMVTFPRHGPPLLAIQGTADPINNAANTEAYYRLAPRPKFLVLLLGASHLPPYTTEQPQLGTVERVTIAFLDHYLGNAPLRELIAAGNRAGVATISEAP
jgi:predicted dienelactone hydrolase